MRGESSQFRSIAVALLLILVIAPLTPVAQDLFPSASAAGGTRHVYTFSTGLPEAMALYQGSSPDRTTTVPVPKGAEILDFEVTLSGASSTGWSSVGASLRADWMKGTSTGTDARSDSLTLALDDPGSDFLGHGLDEQTVSGNTAWLDNGTYSVRQPHTGNSTENRFSPQVSHSSSSFMAQSQGAILKHHDWLFMSTWSGNSFTNLVHRLYPNNATRESTITLDQANCNIQPVYPTMYWGMYGFRDWTVTPDEKLIGILSGYRYHYGVNIQVAYERVVVLDVKYDDIWTCEEVYDIAPQFGDYTGISYDRSRDTVWVVHNSQRRIVSYDFQENGQFSRDSTMYTYQSSSTHECGKSGGLVRGLVVHESLFYMRCRDTTSSWPPRDVLNAWSISGTSTSLVAQTGTRNIPEIGYGLYYDGSRFHTVDCGYYTFGGSTLYYRQFGTGLLYPTNPAPGTSTWVGEPIITTEDVLAVNMETNWGATAQGDRVDYWVSADNGTHWEAVTSNNTIHFAHPGQELRWKMQLIGSTPVSWWVGLEYSTAYETIGDWLSPPVPTGTEIGKVRPTWVEDVPSGTEVTVFVSNDNGTSWTEAENGQDTDFSNEGNILRYNIQMQSDTDTLTPTISSFNLEYLEGFPDRVELDIGDDGTWDWKGTTFLGDSSVVASDYSLVPSEVSATPTLVQAFNQHSVQNGLGYVDIPIAVRAHSSGRILLSDVDLTYRLNSRALDASLEGGVLAPDGDWRTLIVRVVPGDGVTRIDKVSVDFPQSDGSNPSIEWSLNDVCAQRSTGGGRMLFDAGNCTSTIGANDILSVRLPVMATWDWDDQVNLEAEVSVDDNFGRAVTSWTTENLGLRVENDIQLDGMRVHDETGRELLSHDWLRGGYNLTFSGGIYFEGTQLSPEAGQFMLRIIGQNLTQDGDPLGIPITLHEEANPSHGSYSMTFQSPMESTPGGMLFSVEAYNMSNGSTYANPIYNTMRLILDGNSPLVLAATPLSGAEMHKGPPSPGGQAVTVTIQDSVDPPMQINLNYWLGCTSRDEMCSDTNFNGVPDPVEYRTKILTSPETRAGGMNIFEGLIDDSMLAHGEMVSIYVDGQDGQGNIIAMGGGPVCVNEGVPCGTGPGQASPDWDQDLTHYKIREEFEPLLIIENSTIIGHDDKSPLHPGIPYNLALQISDKNGWQDIAGLQLALAGDFDDEQTSIWVTFDVDEYGLPTMNLQSGGAGLAVSNLYSMIAPDPENETLIMLNLRFQLTWDFPEDRDTDGVDQFIPKLEVWDRPCSEGEDIPCHSEKEGLGNDYWSLDNDLRFDTAQGHITAIELRNGINHYSYDEEESLIGAGQVVRFSGRVLFSEDSTPAPAGAFDVVLGDYENSWSTQPHEGGQFSMDFLVPSVRSGHLDLYSTLEDLPGLATDQTVETPRLRLAVDSESPVIAGIKLGGVENGGAAPLSSVSDLQVSLETLDDNGFDFDKPVMMHYVVRAGTSEVSRGSISLDEPTVFGEQIFWSGSLDLTDGGATTILSTYGIDVWVTGADASGNPFISADNTESAPLGHWSFAWSGPQVDLRDPSMDIYWDDPSPHVGQTVTLHILGASANGVSGELIFALEKWDGGHWSDAGEVSTGVHAIDPFHATIDYDVESKGEDGRHTFRVRMLDENLELDRVSISPLLVSDEVARDGEAFASQVIDSKLAVALYIIALVAISYGVFTMVLYRRLLREEEEDEMDHTSDVAEEMMQKQTPELPPDFQVGAPVKFPPPMATESQTATQQDAPAPTPAPEPPEIPEEGLPEGWTQDQWNHYGWKWLEANE